MTLLQTIIEGSATISVPTAKKISKKLPVFYNPLMKLNRDLTVLLLQQLSPGHLCDPLAASGVRAIRFAKEVKHKSIVANDLSKEAVKLIKKNMRKNKVKFNVENKDANLLFAESTGFDFIDLDVFGSPNFLLDPAIKKLSRKGILAVTSTDTAALAGTYPKACKRKYWAIPKRDELMHETAIRILIRKVQLIGMQYDKALIPIFSLAKDHYYRVFFQCIKGKSEVDKLPKQHAMWRDAGPLWTGQLWDKKLTSKMLNHYKKSSNKITIHSNSLQKENVQLLKLLTTINDEAKLSTIGFYDIHKICKRNKMALSMTKPDLLKALKKKGFKAYNTHFTGEGIRSNAPLNIITEILRKNGSKR